jgi:probable HAF family extracellular repeat protein
MEAYMHRLLLAPALSFCFVLTLQTTFAQNYTITDLGTLPGDPISVGFAINQSGQVTGLSARSLQNHAFLFSNGTLSDIGTLGGVNTNAFAINDSAQITGSSVNSVSQEHAFLFSGGSMSDLGTLTGDTFSSGHGINRSGQITGGSGSNNVEHAVVFSNGAITDLGTLGGISSRGIGINQSGQVTGFSLNSDGFSDAFLFSKGTMSDLGRLSGGVGSAGNAINDSGQVAGQSDTSTGDIHAVLFSNATISDLGTIPGDNQSRALAINQLGQIVGRSQSPGLTRPFLFNNGTMSDLNNLIPADSGWTLITAEGINDDGQITGGGNINGVEHAYLLTPTYKAFIQQPINSDGSSVFNGSRGVIPIKFTLAFNGASTCTLPPATVALNRIAGGTTGPVDESTYLSAADNGSNFRISGCQYVYNLAASSLGSGTYRVDISINGVIAGSGVFALK